MAGGSGPGAINQTGPAQGNGQVVSQEEAVAIAEQGAATILFGNIMGMYSQAKKQTDEAIKDSQG